MKVLQTAGMWLLLLALSLPQGLEDAISGLVDAIPGLEDAIPGLEDAISGLEDAISGAAGIYNPERSMNISQKILFHGYPSKEYNVVTEDGYILSLNRIPRGRGDPRPPGSRLPVLIVHGFCMDGGNWVDNFPDNSLGFILADAGYDVWIGNNRGNSWSRRHVNLSIASEEFWDFSFHEMAMYDLPAMVGFVLMQTGQEKLFYVGHGQGSSLGFIAFSSLPQLAEKIKLFFALGPVYTFNYVRGPKLNAVFLPDTVLKARFGTRELVLVRRKDKLHLTEKCSRALAARECATEIFLLGGFSYNNLNLSRMDVYISHFPDYTSVKNLLHWGQTAKTGQFKQFDYGPRNMEKYNRPRPPYYKIEDMKVPVALWSGDRDWVSPPDNTHHLLFHLTSVIHKEHFPDWNHFDYHWGMNAPQNLYRNMVAMMDKNL